ncbi:MAG: Lrp/AsnC family transcriptional regulator [Ignavibacteriaceae bacterium]|nr:Lrp/AsnC family transcriptional regulator [Ignavibacteriaceae bacterium]
MLDNLDLVILNKVQENGRITRSELAELVGMSVPAISERLHRLEEKEVITGYYARVDRHRFGFDIMAFIMVSSESSKHYKSLIQNAEKNANILECHAILGEGSHLIKAIVKNTQSLERLLAEIQTWPGVKSTHTYFVLSSAKESTKIELETNQQIIK